MSCDNCCGSIDCYGCDEFDKERCSSCTELKAVLRSIQNRLLKNYGSPGMRIDLSQIKVILKQIEDVLK